MSRPLVIAGLVAMLIGALDPLEGSLLILPGTGLLALEAWLGKSRQQALAYWSFALTAAGVGALFALSVLGGLGGRTGRSYWWALVMLPYPAGWVLGLACAIQRLRRPASNAQT